MLRVLVFVSFARASDALCVGLPDNASVTDGTTLSIGECYASDKQKWSIRYGQIFYAADPSKCVDLLGGNSSSGTMLGLWDCYSGQNQMWSFDEDDGTMHWGRDRSKCVIYSDQSGDLVIWDCDDLQDDMTSVVHDDFSFATDENFCVELPSGDIENGVFLPMGYCDGSEKQQWSFQEGQMKYAADSTKCVDLLGGVPASGTLLGLWDCFDGDLAEAQLWTFDDTGTMHWGKDSTKCIIYAGLSDNLRIWDCDKRRDWMMSVVRKDFSSPELSLVI